MCQNSEISNSNYELRITDYGLRMGRLRWQGSVNGLRGGIVGMSKWWLPKVLNLQHQKW